MRISTIICVMVSLIALPCLADSFWLKYEKTGKVYGPFELRDGEQITIGARTFTLLNDSRTRTPKREPVAPEAPPTSESQPSTRQRFTAYLLLDQTEAEQRFLDLFGLSNAFLVPGNVLIPAEIMETKSFLPITDGSTGRLIGWSWDPSDVKRPALSVAAIHHRCGLPTRANPNGSAMFRRAGFITQDGKRVFRILIMPDKSHQKGLFPITYDAPPRKSAEPKRTTSATKHTGQSPLPPCESKLVGTNEVRVRNPNLFSVVAAVRAGKKGIDFSIGPGGVSSAFVPDGSFDIYFLYSNEPDALYQGDKFSLQGNGLEIQITKVVGGNYGIQRVK